MGWFDERFEPKDGRIRFDCSVCKKAMWFPPSKHGKYVTCGDECAKKRYEQLTSDRVRCCETCGNEFKPRRRQLAAGHGKYCSQKCNTSSHVAVNSAEAQTKAKAGWKKRHQIQPIVKSGEENPGWKGGRKATYKRALISGKRRAYYANRRDRNGVVRADPKIVKKLGDQQGWRCVVCSTRLLKYELDHIVPVSRGGTNESHNFQLLCVSCNRKKGAKDPVDFMQQRGFLL